MAIGMDQAEMVQQVVTDLHPPTPPTERPSLPPSSHSRCPAGATCVPLSLRGWSPWGENYEVHSFRDGIGRGRVVPLGRWRIHRGGETLKSLPLATHPVVPACQQLRLPFWLLEPHGLSSALPLARNPSRRRSAPNRLAAGSRRVGARLLAPRDRRGGYRCPSALSHSPVTRNAGRGSRRFAEEQGASLGVCVASRYSSTYYVMSRSEPHQRLVRQLLRLYTSNTWGSACRSAAMTFRTSTGCSLGQRGANAMPRSGIADTGSEAA